MIGTTQATRRSPQRIDPSSGPSILIFRSWRLARHNRVSVALHPFYLRITFPFSQQRMWLHFGNTAVLPWGEEMAFYPLLPRGKRGGGGTPAGAPTKHTCCRDDCAIERGNDLQKSAGICCRLEISQFKGLFRLPMGQLDAASAALAEESPMQTVQATQFALREARP